MIDARKKRARRAIAVLGAVLLGGTALSSWATQDIASRLDHHPALGTPIADGFYQPFAWVSWQQQPWAAGMPGVFLPAKSGAMGLMLAVCGISLALIMRSTNRPKAYPTSHGTARWADEKEIRAAGLLGKAEGVYIGAWTDKAGRVHYLRHDGPEHVSAIAPTRSGKGVGLVVPTLLSATESAVILDEQAELWEITACWRKSIGQTVLRWNPGSPDNSCAFNFLAEVRLETEHEVADAQNVAGMILDPDGRGLKDHWDRTGFALLTGVILHVMYLANAEGKVASLPDVAMAVSTAAAGSSPSCSPCRYRVTMKRA